MYSKIWAILKNKINIQKINLKSVPGTLFAYIYPERVLIHTYRDRFMYQAKEYETGYAKSFIGRRNHSTLKRSVTISGKGVHSGKITNLTLHPAQVGTGVVFRNPVFGEIPVTPYSVVDTNHAVTLGNQRGQIATVEHLLFALAVTGITDAVIEVDAGELPILDGSAAPLCEAIIESAGIMDLGLPVEPIVIKTPLWVIQGDRYVIALPHDGFRVSSGISYEHPLLRGEFLGMDLDSEICLRELADARTFGFLRDIERLQSRNLALGASLENAVVLTDDGYLNDSLRHENECIRHKMLDIIGDLYLIGRPLVGHIIASKTGHGLNVELGKKILAAQFGDELGIRRAADARFVPTVNDNFY